VVPCLMLQTLHLLWHSVTCVMLQRLRNPWLMQASPMQPCLCVMAWAKVWLTGVSLASCCLDEQTQARLMLMLWSMLPAQAMLVLILQTWLCWVCPMLLLLQAAGWCFVRLTLTWKQCAACGGMHATAVAISCMQRTLGTNGVSVHMRC
jgi:hypothetical protein